MQLKCYRIHCMCQTTCDVTSRGMIMYNEGLSTTRKQLHKNNTNHASKGVLEELSKFVHKLISPPTNCDNTSSTASKFSLFSPRSCIDALSEDGQWASGRGYSPHTVDTALSPIDDVLPLLAHAHCEPYVPCTYEMYLCLQHYVSALRCRDKKM